MPGEISEYERIRLKNIEDNKRILAELGLMNPFGPLPKVIKKTAKRRPATPKLPPAKKCKVDTEDGNETFGSVHGPRRRSARFQGKEPKSPAEINEEIENEEEDDDYKPRVKIPPGRANMFGAIPGVEIGTTWETRMECCAAGVHRPTVAGIHGGEEGAYSIALSGGYEDDIDMGEVFTYTGQGGRDLKGTKMKPKNLRTAPQSKDQTLTHGNLALSRNVETNHPVRVIRGYKSRSRYAPEWGYRYDGLYSVEKSWFTTGVSGFGVWKFALRRLKDQTPPPWEYEEKAKVDNFSQDSGVASDRSDAGSEVSEQQIHGAEKLDEKENDCPAGDDHEQVDLRSEPDDVAGKAEAVPGDEKEVTDEDNGDEHGNNLSDEGTKSISDVEPAKGEDALLDNVDDEVGKARESEPDDGAGEGEGTSSDQKEVFDDENDNDHGNKPNDGRTDNVSDIEPAKGEDDSLENEVDKDKESEPKEEEGSNKLTSTDSVANDANRDEEENTESKEKENNNNVDKSENQNVVEEPPKEELA